MPNNSKRKVNLSVLRLTPITEMKQRTVPAIIPIVPPISFFLIFHHHFCSKFHFFAKKLKSSNSFQVSVLHLENKKTIGMHGHILI